MFLKSTKISFIRRFCGFDTLSDLVESEFFGYKSVTFLSILYTVPRKLATKTLC